MSPALVPGTVPAAGMESVGYLESAVLSVLGRGHVEGVILIVESGKGWAPRTRRICEITKTQMCKGVHGLSSQPVSQYPGAEHAANTLTSLLLARLHHPDGAEDEGLGR